MINVFYRNRNTIGQFMVALMFLGTFGFLFTSDGFVSESQASGCCGGGEAVVTAFAADSSGDFGSDIPMDAPSTGGCCSGEGKVIPSSSNNDGGGNGDDCTCISGGCGDCGKSMCMGAETVSCDNRCDNKSSCGTDSDPPRCEDNGEEYCPNDPYSGGDSCNADC